MQIKHLPYHNENIKMHLEQNMYVHLDRVPYWQPVNEMSMVLLCH